MLYQMLYALCVTVTIGCVVLYQADNSLVVLEIGSQQVCESGYDEEPELHWKEDKKEKDEQLWGMCRNIKHVFQRTARECPDVKFLALDVSGTLLLTPAVVKNWFTGKYRLSFYNTKTMLVCFARLAVLVLSFNC